MTIIHALIAMVTQYQGQTKGQIYRQRAKHNRQRCIQILEKITKNLFRLFRNPNTTKEQLIKRFTKLKKQLDMFKKVQLDSAYHKAMRNHIEHFAQIIQGDFDLEKHRTKQMTQLNRIQKIKNATVYRKDKHRKDARDII